MAYKFQRGAAVASGSFTAEEGLTSNNALSVTAGTSTLQAVSATTVTGSGLAQFQSLTVNGGTSTFSTVDINGGAIDGVTIGTSTAVTQFTASNSSLGAAVATSLVTTTVRATNYKANDNTAAITIADSTGAVTISTDLIASGNVTLGDAGTDIITVAGVFTSSLNPNVTGQNDLGITSKLWRNVKAQYLSSSIDLLVGGAATVANGLTVTAGTLTAATVDINGGAIDGTAIGAAAQSTGQFTTLSASSTLQVAGATTLNNGLTVSNGDSSVQKLTVNGDLIVLGTTFSASVGSLLIEDAAIVIGDGSTTFGTGYGLLFGSGSNQWASLQTAQFDIDGDTVANDIMSSSLPIKAPSFYGTLYGTMAQSITAITFNSTASAGVNYFTGSPGAPVQLSLPTSPSVGDSVKIKAAADCSTTNTVTINRAGSHTIDGETFVVLESSHAALEFVYVAANTWKIF